MAKRVFGSAYVVKTVTLTLDTAQYGSGDLLAAPQEITGLCSQQRGAILHSLTVLDKDDQGGSMEFLFTGDSISMGTENAAYAIAQANAYAIQARVPVASGDFTDYGSFRYAQYGPTATGMGGVLRPTSGTSLWLGAISRDTKTHSAAGIVVNVGFLLP